MEHYVSGAHKSIILAYAAVRGIGMVVVAGLLDVHFQQAVILAVISGSLGSVGTGVAAYISGRQAKQTHKAVQEVADKVDNVRSHQQ